MTSVMSFINRRVSVHGINSERFSAEKLIKRRSKSEDFPAKKNVRKLLNAEITNVHNLVTQVSMILSGKQLLKNNDGMEI